MLVPWQERIDAEQNRVVGSTLVTLTNQGCYYKECTIGNFVTDAFVFYVSSCYQKNQDVRFLKVSEELSKGVTFT